MQGDRSTPIRFGRVQVLPVQRQLLVEGSAVALGSRAFDLLLVLIAHRDRVVGKHELLDRVWPGLVVEEGNLKVHVSTLRRLIGAECIATIPARGYRFALPLDGDAEGVHPPEPARMGAAPMLPLSGTPMIGRDDELASLQALLLRHRLVTLLGAGGIGKTTLALEAARQRLAGEAEVVWVELAAVGDSAQVAAALAQALCVSQGEGELGARLIAALQSRRLLVVIDNAEHVVDGVAALAQHLVAGTPEVRLLVTSQVALRVAGERIFRLGPLQVPDAVVSPVEALDYGAVALFVERAQTVQRHFALTDDNLATVIDICRGLDGLALAIELAAARLPLLGVAGLASRLDERLRLLAGGVRTAPTRQQTLRAALDWSHALLSAAEAAVFRRLGVFAGGFTLELAAAVATDEQMDSWCVMDVLGTLVERSMVAVDGADPPRYRLLESPRRYALLMLDAAGERAAMQRRHAQALRDEAERQEAALWRIPESTWLRRHACELDNLRQAWSWATQHEPALAIALAGASFHLFNCLALMHESRQRADPLVALLDSTPVPARDAARFLRVRAFQMRDVSARVQHDLALRSAALYRGCADPEGLHESLYVLTQGLHAFSADAQAALREMLALERADWPPARRALGCIAMSMDAYVDGRMDDNRAALEAALPLVTGAGADRLTMVVLGNLADHVLLMGPLSEAVRRGRELTALLRDTGRTAQLPLALCNLANAQLQLADAASARATLAEALAVMRVQQWGWLRGFGDVYALLAAQEGRADDAAHLLGWADAVRRERGARQPNEARCRQQAMERIATALLPDQLRQAMARGALLLPEQVSDLALARSGGAATAPGC